MIRTFEDAYAFVLEKKLCRIFGSQGSPHPSLWDHTDLPERQPGEKGWGEKVTAIWTWKTTLPATFPDEIFYGKLPGGDAALIELGYLAATHYPAAHREVDSLGPLPRKLFAAIRLEPWFTGDLRRAMMAETGCTKSRFDTALKTLQSTLNIARSNAPEESRDRWLTFRELYPEIADR